MPGHRAGRRVPRRRRRATLLKCIVFDVDGELGLALVPGDREVNEYALVGRARAEDGAALHRRRLRRASRAARRATSARTIADVVGRRRRPVGRGAASGGSPARTRPTTTCATACSAATSRSTCGPTSSRSSPATPARAAATRSRSTAASRSATCSSSARSTPRRSTRRTPTSNGEQHPMVMGCYGIGISRIARRRRRGVPRRARARVAGRARAVRRAPRRAPGPRRAGRRRSWPRPTRSTTSSQARGVAVLYDDRDASPGVKFADADLVGMPVQLVVGAKGLARGIVERKVRGDAASASELPLADVVADDRGVVTLPLSPPIDPMLAKLTRELPPAGKVLYEPKWDGFRCIVFRDGDDLDLQSRNSKPLLRYFPELREPLLAQLPEQCVVDGELVVANERGLDFDALQLRQHPAESRVKKLAVGDPGVVRRVRSARARRREPVRGRRSASGARSSEKCSAEGEAADPRHARDARPRHRGRLVRPLRRRGLRRCRRQAARRHLRAGQAHDAEGEARAHRRLRRRRVPHPQGRQRRRFAPVRSLRRRRRAAPRRRRERHGRAGAQGSCSPRSSRCARTRSTNHPWRDWAEAFSARGGQRMPGGPSRWNADKDLSWEPLRIERVVRGRVRRPDERPLPAQRPLPALARRPGPRQLHLLPTRDRRPRRTERTLRRLTGIVMATETRDAGSSCRRAADRRRRLLAVGSVIADVNAMCLHVGTTRRRTGQSAVECAAWARYTSMRRSMPRNAMLPTIRNSASSGFVAAAQSPSTALRRTARGRARDVHVATEDIAAAPRDVPVVHARAARHARIATREAFDDFDRGGNRRRCSTEPQQCTVAEKLHEAGIGGQRLAGHGFDAVDDLDGRTIAVALGERGEADDVDEGDGAGRLDERGHTASSGSDVGGFGRRPAGDGRGFRRHFLRRTAG